MDDRKRAQAAQAALLFDGLEELISRADVVVADLQAVSRVLLNHSLPVGSEVDIFVANFENWGRRDVSSELPRVISQAQVRKLTASR